MKKFDDIKNLYKNNKNLFNDIILLLNIVLIFWQALFALISPNRLNVLILLILIGSLVYQLIKNP